MSWVQNEKWCSELNNLFLYCQN